MKSIILKIYEDGSLGPLKGLWRLKISIRIEVPEELQEVIIRQYYNDLVYGHPRVA
jgi:predicted DNA-binding antitoxin AbrB/MazE fold protein